MHHRQTINAGAHARRGRLQRVVLKAAVKTFRVPLIPTLHEADAGGVKWNTRVEVVRLTRT
jgi:hypothetical protein